MNCLLIGGQQRIESSIILEESIPNPNDPLRKLANEELHKIAERLEKIKRLKKEINKAKNTIKNKFI